MPRSSRTMVTRCAASSSRLSSSAGVAARTLHESTANATPEMSRSMRRVSHFSEFCARRLLHEIRLDALHSVASGFLGELQLHHAVPMSELLGHEEERR